MTELLVGTKKGLFVLEGDAGLRLRGDRARVRRRARRVRAARPALGRLLAAVSSPFYGPKVFFTDDPAGEWEQATGVELPEGGDKALERMWILHLGEADGQIFAGGDPGVLFESRDGGASSSSTARSGSTRRDRSGSRAAAGCACTRSRRGPASRTGSRSRSPRPACG